MTTSVATRASENQLGFIRRLLTERQVPAEAAARLTAQMEDGSLLLRPASDAISWLLTQPRIDAPEPVTEEGIYERDGVVYKVQQGASGNCYAKVLSHEIATIARLTAAGETVHARFEYVPGAIFRIGPADRVSLERARELGHLTATCMVCGKKLEDAKSVKAGIGPVCAESL